MPGREFWLPRVSMISVLDGVDAGDRNQQIKIDDMQFGLMKGKGTTDAIFMA